MAAAIQASLPTRLTYETMSENPQAQPETQNPNLPPIKFEAGGESEPARKANLESVLPSPGYPTLAFILADAIAKRVEMIVFDFSQQSVVVRFKIDGMWHQMPMIDRQTGDYMLATAKQLAGMNYRERRARQEGTFHAEFGGVDYKCVIVSQGIKTGERVAFTIRHKKLPEVTPEDLGMRPKLKDKAISAMNQEKGLVVITSMPGDGFTSSWVTLLGASDRFMRDVVAVEDVHNQEPEVINIRSETYDPQKHETPVTNIDQLLLREPDVFVFPEIPNGRVLDRYCDLATKDEKMVITRINAKHAVDGLFRLMLLKPTIEKLAESLTAIVYHRLIRLLCDNCKQGFAPNPAMLQRLGIPPGRIANMYTHFQVRPEDAVDENGNPIEIQPCEHCGGLGYHGRTAIYEVLEINDQIREAMIKNPKLDAIMQIAQQTGHISLRDEGVVLAAKGVTSIEELQRVLKK